MSQEKFLKGKEHFGNREFDLAIPYLNEVLNHEHNHVQALYFRAVSLRHTDQLELSLADLNKAVSLQPNDPDLVSERGVAHIHLKDGDSALIDMEKALILDERSFRYSTRAFVKTMRKDYDGAIADYEKAIELDPKDEVAYNNLSLVQEKLGWKEKAAKNAKKADELALINRPDQHYNPSEASKIETNNHSDKIEKDNPFNNKKKTESELTNKVMNEKNDLSLNEKDDPVHIEELPIDYSVSSYLNIIKSVFKSKQQWTEFVSFIKNGLKLKKD